MTRQQQRSCGTWGIAILAMVLAVAAGVVTVIFLAVRGHVLLEVAGVAVNVGLLAVACLALVVARSQAVSARAAIEQTETARRAAADKERDAAAQAIADSQRANRPYLWADLVPSLHGAPRWDLVIRNTGRTLAHDVVIDVDPWPEPGDLLGDRLRKHLTRPFDMPPGSSLRFTWRIAREDDEPGNPDQPAGMPAETTITLRYRGDDPALGPFTEPRFLDHPTRASIIPAPQKGDNALSVSDPVEKTLKNIEYAIRGLSSHVGELRR